MKYTDAIKVFSCCGEYIAVSSGVKNKKFICPRCGKELTVPDKYPKIKIVTNK